MTKTLVGTPDPDEPGEEQPWRPSLTAPGATSTPTTAAGTRVTSESSTETWTAPVPVTTWTVSWPGGG